MAGSSEQAAEAKAEVFITAFRTLSPDVRRRVLAGLLSDSDLLEDVEAALLWEERKDEPRRSLRDYMAERDAR